MAATLKSSSTRCYGKYSQCPAFDIKQSPAGRSPEDRQTPGTSASVGEISQDHHCHTHLRSPTDA